VISGDNAVSVGAVAGSLGLDGETMDARRLPDKPEQLATLSRSTRPSQGASGPEARMVARLQSRGHTVR